MPEPWSNLPELSAELPAEPEGRPARRAVSVNDWTIADAWSAIFDLVPTEDTVAWNTQEEGRFSPLVRELWTQKMGNKPEEWEDAYATDSVGGAIVVADGASSGIYCRIWADQLAKRFLTDRPDARDPLAFGKWVHVLRGEWRTAINYSTLNWAKQRKVDEVGAAATFLSLEVGPLDATGNRPWRACAVGDATLFLIRSGQLQVSFPVVAADQFGSAPLLIRSNPGFKTLALIASGMCRPGDRFMLATDAVAARLLKSTTIGPGPDWDRFQTIDDQEWRKELDELRKTHDMVNDDCTLIVLEVAAGGAVVEAQLAPVAPLEQRSEATSEQAEPTEPATPLAQPDTVPPTEELPGEVDHVPEPVSTPPVTAAEGMLQCADTQSEAIQHDGEEEGGTVPPTPECDTPHARDGFPESTDTNATV
jgi:hypothetical protein